MAFSFNIRNKGKNNLSALGFGNKQMSIGAKQTADQNKKNTFISNLGSNLSSKSALTGAVAGSVFGPVGSLAGQTLGALANQGKQNRPAPEAGMKGFTTPVSTPSTSYSMNQPVSTPSTSFSTNQIASPQDQASTRQTEGVTSGLTGVRPTLGSFATGSSLTAPRPGTPGSQTPEQLAEIERVRAAGRTPMSFLQDGSVAPGQTGPTFEAGLGALQGTRTAGQTEQTQTTPTISPEQQRLEDARQRYLATLGPDADITAQQNALADFQMAANQAIAGEEGQGRGKTVDLVRGRQALIQEQASLEEANRIARLQTSIEARGQAQQVALAEMGFAQEDVNRIMTQQTPFEFGGNLVKYDPATGELITIAEAPQTAAEGFTLSEGQARYDAQGNLIATGLQAPVDELAQMKQALEIQKLQQELAGGGDYNRMLSVSELESLNISPTDYFGLTVGGAMQGLQSGQIKTTQNAQDIARVRESIGRVDTIDEILNSPGLGSAVGLGFLTRGGPSHRREREDLYGAVNELVSEETLNTLTELKDKGGTLGAISEKELAILQTAATRMGQWIDRDKNGNITKIKIGEKQFIDEINRIKSELLFAVDDTLNNGVYTTMFNQGSITEEEYVELVRGLQSTSFSSDLGTSLNGLGDINNTQNLPPVQKTVSNAFGSGIITGYGSNLWKPGLDYVLPGGKNADVKLPMQTQVIAVVPEAKSGGFGNQVRLRMPDGKELWISHLDKVNVNPGQTLAYGYSLGKQGNTGNTYGKTGIHLDLTMPKQGGGYYTAEQVAAYLRTA